MEIVASYRDGATGEDRCVFRFTVAENRIQTPDKIRVLLAAQQRTAWQPKIQARQNPLTMPLSAPEDSTAMM